MSTGVLICVCLICAIAWYAVAYKGYAIWRSQHDALAWAYWGGYLGTALTFSLSLPPIVGAVDRLTGLSPAGYFLSDVVALTTCWLWLFYLHRLDPTDPVAKRLTRRAAAVVVGALAIMTLRFALAPGRVDHHFHADPRAIYLGLYRLLFLATMGFHFCCFIILLRRYRTRVHKASLRMRLWLMTGAAGSGLLSVGYEALLLSPAPLPQAGGAMLMLVAALCLATSLTLSTRLSHLEIQLQGYRTSQCLRPLWQALRVVDPTLSYLPPPTARQHRWPGRRLTFHLRRQVFEIRDWSLALYRYVPSGAAPYAKREGRQAGFPDTELPPLIEAVRLASALSAWRQIDNATRSGADIPDYRAPGIDVEPPLTTIADWQAETAYLRKVAIHFQRSPIVRAAVAQLVQPAPAADAPAEALPEPTTGTAATP